MLRISITGFDADPNSITTVLGIIPSQSGSASTQNSITAVLGIIQVESVG